VEGPPAADGESGPARFVGRQACLDCHPNEDALWQGSDHALAMQLPTDDTVLGDFSGTSYNHFGVETTFFRDDGKFMVRTDGPDGKLHDYEVAYLFGFEPLEQYLIEFPDGRYQALNVCWDNRPADEGGQRWFHLYPDHPTPYTDPFHWTGTLQNWNFMCAECHSTDLRKGYDLATDTYATTYSEINVSCEACHGPGSNHVAIATAAQKGQRPKQDARLGLMVSLKDPNAGVWEMDQETGNAKRSAPIGSRHEVETCGRCHVRRSVVHDDYRYGRPLMDTHRPALLTQNLYYPDGQILDEVYVYASMLQSKMFAHGVTCSDCHDGHSLELRAPQDGVCSQCHLPSKYAVREHHFHDPADRGASCLDCHMPATRYMVIDPRRDHSWRVPRPDLTVSIGSPNTCNWDGCHPEKSPQWAAETMDGWYGTGWRKPHYGEVLNLGRTRGPGARDALLGLIGNAETPAIVRATALVELQGSVDASSLPSIHRAATDPDPLVRRSALLALSLFVPEQRLAALPLLEDPVRAVRVEAARLLAPVDPDQLEAQQAQALSRGLAELEESLMVDADRAAAHMTLGAVYVDLGRYEDAERAYGNSLRLDPRFGPAVINLADLYRLQGRDAEGERALVDFLARNPESGVVHHALGLVLVRENKYEEGVRELGLAAELRPDDPRYAFVYGVGLQSIGRVGESIGVWEQALDEHPHDLDLLSALVNSYAQAGELDRARDYARRLAAIRPEDPDIRGLLSRLGG
jgi:Flp pilus assembly protein TadD